MNIIREYSPLSKVKMIIYDIIYVLVFLIIGLFSGDIRICLLFFLVGVVPVLIIVFFDKSYSGWSMGEKSILLKKNDLFKGLMSIELLYNEIESVVYVEAPKRPREVLFKVKGKTYSLRPRIDVFKFAPILRYFKTIGIVVRLQEKDHEIELFLEGKIDKVPMTNDMKIYK